MERFNNRFANMFLTNAEIANLNEPAYEDDSDLESLSDSITSLSESIETLSDSFTNESNAIANEIQNYINQLIENRYNNQLITTLNTELINSYTGNHQDIEKWRKTESIRKTLKRRPDLINFNQLNEEEKEIYYQILEENSKELE